MIYVDLHFVYECIQKAVLRKYHCPKINIFDGNPSHVY